MRVFFRWRHLQVVNSLPSLIEYVMGRVNPRVVRRDSVTGVYWNVMLLDIRVNKWNYILVQVNPYWMASLGEMDSGRMKEVGCLIEVKTIEKPSLGFWLLAAYRGGYSKQPIKIKPIRKKVSWCILDSTMIGPIVLLTRETTNYYGIVVSLFPPVIGWKLAMTMQHWNGFLMYTSNFRINSEVAPNPLLHDTSSLWAI